MSSSKLLFNMSLMLIEMIEKNKSINNFTYTNKNYHTYPSQIFPHPPFWCWDSYFSSFY